MLDHRSTKPITFTAFRAFVQLTIGYAAALWPKTRPFFVNLCNTPEYVTAMPDKLHGFTFYPQDYFGDSLVRLMPLDLRLVWIEAFFLMDQSPRRGVLLKPSGGPFSYAELAGIMNGPEETVERALTWAVREGIASIDKDTGAVMCRRMAREGKRRHSRSMSDKTSECRPRDLAMDCFCERCQALTGVPYSIQKKDAVQLAKLRKAFAVDNLLEPPHWAEAVNNYFASPLGSYSLADLSARYVVFSNSAVDGYNKPINHQNRYGVNGNGAKSKAKQITEERNQDVRDFLRDLDENAS